MPGPEYTPTLDPSEQERIRRWHERASAEIRAAGPRTVTYLGRELAVPADVFPPARMSELLGRAVLAEVRDDDRVLDMGTGSGVNAILAAVRSRDVLGVDINPSAVACATENAERNGVGARTSFRVGDLFDAADGRFDLIVFDPPFRWFAPRDMLERAYTDEKYRTLTTFFDQVRGHLNDRGRVLIFFGTSGDLGYLHTLTERAGLVRHTVATEDLTRDDHTVTYVTYRLTTSARDA